ncbi:MAG: hypothetical protein U9P90_04660 [Patescibacteria group bacterium]|nr:hypothetical protein [Patescibacteria group bacterium]
MKTKICPDCDGRGKVEIEISNGRHLRIGWAICPTCEGSGEIPDNSPDDDDNDDGNVNYEIKKTREETKGIVSCFIQ